MSVSSADAGRPLPSATSHDRLRQLARLIELGQEGARADLDVHDERVEAGGELLGQDRGDDQRAATRPCRSRRGSRTAAGRRGRARRSGRRSRSPPRRPPRAGARAPASRRSRGSTRACPASRRCGRARARRSSGPRRRTRRRSARAAARPCRPRRRSSACRARAPRGPAPSSRARRRSRIIAPVRATRSSAVMPCSSTAIANAPTCASLTLAVGDAAHEPLDLVAARASPPSRLRRMSSCGISAGSREPREQVVERASWRRCAGARAWPSPRP